MRCTLKPLKEFRPNASVSYQPPPLPRREAKADHSNNIDTGLRMKISLETAKQECWLANPPSPEQCSVQCDHRENNRNLLHVRSTTDRPLGSLGSTQGLLPNHLFNYTVRRGIFCQYRNKQQHGLTRPPFDKAAPATATLTP